MPIINPPIPLAVQSQIVRTMAGGRPTLSTGVPVLTSDVSGATTIFYTPYLHDQIALYDGNNWNATTFTELSQATTDTSKSPAAVAASSVYDLFVWNDAGTIRCTRGPAWTNDTTRSAGTALAMINGILTNAVSITNGPAANRGRYVGSVRSNAGSTIDCLFGGSAAGGSQAWIGIWSQNNRVDAVAFVADSTATWTYNSTTYQAKDASNSNRISMMRGQNEDGVWATNVAHVNSGVGAAGICGIALDATNALAARSIEGKSYGAAAGVQSDGSAIYSGLPGLGFHFLQAIEKADAASAVNFSGSPVSAIQAVVHF